MCVDIAYICGTDFGNQLSLMCSLDTFEEFYKPYYQKNEQLGSPGQPDGTL